MENLRTTRSRTRTTATSQTRMTSSLAPIKPESVRQGTRVPLGQISVNSTMSNVAGRSEINQPLKIGGLQNAKHAKVLPEPSKIQDSNVKPSTTVPLENRKDKSLLRYEVDMFDSLTRSFFNTSATSAVDNLENIPPSKVQGLDSDDEILLDDLITDLSDYDNYDDDDDDDDDDDYVLSETSDEDSPMPLEGSSNRDGDLPGSDILSSVEDYTRDIVIHTRKIERNFMAKPKYMTKQPDISFSTRSILVEWMLEVGQEDDFHTETIFLAVNYLDRFLSVMAVCKSKLQLVGTTCMFIASKYEEVHPLDVNEFCYLTDGSCTKNQVLQMEGLILKALAFQCSSPTALFFVKHFSKLAGSPVNCQESSLAQYLAEMSLLDLETYVCFLPSVIGAACVTLSRHYLDMTAWEDVGMVEKTGYQIKDFKDCLDCLHKTFTDAPIYPQQIVREKYKSSKYHQVAFLTPVPFL